MVTIYPSFAVAANLEIDIKNEIDLKDGNYLAREYGGQGRYALISHNHGRFESGDIAEAVCTSGFLITPNNPLFLTVCTIL